jgi:ornithine decarboxylase
MSTGLPAEQHPDPATGAARRDLCALGAAPASATDRIDKFLARESPSTPCVIIDLEIVGAQYRALQALFPAMSIYYAVKANPAPEVIAALAALGASFDLASEGEIARYLGMGLPATRCSFGNTIKREAEIAQAHAVGIDLFAFDSPAELEKLARAAPGARVFCRMLVRNHGAEWPLTRKFGCDRQTAAELLLRASRLGLRPAGVSFHVGSQQTEPQRWTVAIAHAAEIFRRCSRDGVRLELLNLGGGLPARYRTPVPDLSVYAETIEAALGREFGGARPQILLEPGRYLVGDAGLLRASVLLIAERPYHDGERWIYLDAGRYNGLPETLDERIAYRLRTPRDGGRCGRVVLAGPTCDSTDILYEKSRYELPLALTIGDHVDFLSAGAYTASYASVEFNGFRPIRSYCI